MKLGKKKKVGRGKCEVGEEKKVGSWEESRSGQSQFSDVVFREGRKVAVFSCSWQGGRLLVC